jgi:hypothetical protein
MTKKNSWVGVSSSFVLFTPMGGVVGVGVGIVSGGVVGHGVSDADVYKVGVCFVCANDVKYGFFFLGGTGISVEFGYVHLPLCVVSVVF